MTEWKHWFSGILLHSAFACTLCPSLAYPSMLCHSTAHWPPVELSCMHCCCSCCHHGKNSRPDGPVLTALLCPIPTPPSPNPNICAHLVAELLALVLHIDVKDLPARCIVEVGRTLVPHLQVLLQGELACLTVHGLCRPLDVRHNLLQKVSVQLSIKKLAAVREEVQLSTLESYYLLAAST